MLALFVMGNFSSFAQHELFVFVDGANTITDTEMKEDEKAIRYTVKVATGALIIEQKL